MDVTSPSADYLSRKQSRLAALREKQRDQLSSTNLAITLEIGSGHGHYLTAYAAAHPEAFCVGIDIASDRIIRAERKRSRAGLANLRFIRADAHEFLDSLPAENRLAAIFILFPDPWPKRRHHKNRIFQPALLDKLAARAPEGTPLYFRTDHAPYFAEAVAVLAGHVHWEPSPAAIWPFELTTVFQARAQSYQSLVGKRKR